MIILSFYIAILMFKRVIRLCIIFTCSVGFIYDSSSIIWGKTPTQFKYNFIPMYPTTTAGCNACS